MALVCHGFAKNTEGRFEDLDQTGGKRCSEARRPGQDEIF